MELEDLDLLEQLGGLSGAAADLGSPDQFVQERAAAAVWYLSKSHAMQGQMKQLLPALIDCLQSSCGAAQEHAAGALQEVAHLKENHADILSSQGHMALLAAVKDGSAQAQTNAAGALLCLAQSPNSCFHMIETSPLKAMTEMLSAYRPTTQLHAISLLEAAFVSITASPDSRAMNIVAEQFVSFNGVEKLATSLENPLLRMQHSAMACLRMLTVSHQAAESTERALEMLLKMARSTTTASSSQCLAAATFAGLMHHRHCSQNALQPHVLNSVLQLFHSAEAAVEGSALQALDLLAASQPDSAQIAASGLLNESIMCKILYSPVTRKGLAAETQQARILRRLSDHCSLRAVIINCASSTGDNYHHVLADMLISACADIQIMAAWIQTNLEVGADAETALASPMQNSGLLVTLLASEHEIVQRSAVMAISEVSYANDSVKQQLYQICSLEPLVKLLSSSSAFCQEHAAEAIRNICGYNEVAGQQALELGCLPPLIALLASSSLRCQKNAALAIGNICGNDSARQQAAALGALPPLIALLADGNIEDEQAKAQAQWTLEVLARTEEVRQQIRALQQL